MPVILALCVCVCRSVWPQCCMCGLGLDIMAKAIDCVVEAFVLGVD